MKQLFANNANSTLSAGITDVQTTIALPSGEGAKFPSPKSGEEYFKVTLTQYVAAESSWEICYCTARSGDTLTVTRGQDGTTAAAWAGGSKVSHRVTRKDLEYLSQAQLALDGLDQTVMASTTFVDAFIYDTSKDSDGGAWRKRCSHTSWENETLSGNWLGSAANETAARLISGAATGSYYYDTTAAYFRTLNAGSGVTRTYRGNTRQFPAKVLITLETSGRVIIWDLTQAGCPMWLDFGVNLTGYTGTATSVFARDGVIAHAGSAGLIHQSFITDSGLFRQSGQCRATPNISSRTGTPVLTVVPSASSYYIAANACNAVAITVLPNAPIDVATGLPVPTIAVGCGASTATGALVCVIKGDGTVVASDANSHATFGVEFDKDFALLFHRNASYINVKKVNYPSYLTAGFTANAYNNGSTPNLTAGKMLGQYDSVPISNGFATAINGQFLSIIKDNPTTPALGMVHYANKDFASGWLVGDIRGAWLSDIVAETLTASTLISDDFGDGDYSVWTLGAGATAVETGGELTLTNGSADYGYAARTCSLVAGKAYRITADIVGSGGGAAAAVLNIGSAPGSGSVIGNQTEAGVEAGVTFVSNYTGTVYLTLIVGGNVLGAWRTFGDVSLVSADADRSVKANGLIVNGSITKAAVASGAQLVGYSGWSAANYAEQPYSANFDFGTSDFCIMGWLKEAPNSANEIVFSRGYYTGGAWSGSGFAFKIDSAGLPSFFISDDAYVTTDTVAGAVAVDDSVWRFFVMGRRGSNIELWINAAQAATPVAIINAAGSLSNANAAVAVGLYGGGAYSAPNTNGTAALWRGGATMPTAEQIAEIYELEKPLFEVNAQCCLAGTSNTIVALGYDEESDLLHAMTSYGRSTFKGLVRVASEATAVGTPKAVAAGGGIIAQLGSTTSDIYVPAYSLREELTRLDDQMAAFGQNLVAHDFDATSSQTTFTLPVGWEIVSVYAASGAGSATLQREGSGKQWTRTFDGFKWSAVFAAGRTASDWVSILAKRK